MMKFLKPIVFALPAILAACGGGGGSSGTTTEQYSIALRAEKSILPVNVAGERAGQGVYAPYTTTLYVSAKRGNEIIPGGENIFACNMSAGLDSASLYYLDGNEDHEDDDGYPLPYRSITLGSNSGGSSFHLHAKNQAGKATVVCSVTDPRDGKQYAASVDVTVGGGSTNTPASVATHFSSPTIPGDNYLGTVGNTDNMPSSAVLQTEVWNDNNQPVSASGKANVQVSILPTGYANDASAGARLMAGGKTGQSLLLSSNAGIAQYSIASGSKKGVIFVKTVTDRADNDVSNGIQEPIEHLFVVSVTDVRPSATALAVDTAQFDDVTIQNGQPFAFPLAATGGTLPYTWTLASALPSGLSLSSSGILQGTVRVDTPGTRNVVLVVTDARGASVTVRMPLVIEGTLPLDPVNLVINGCSGSSVCQLPGGVVGSAYSHVLSASGGSPMTWVFSGLPSWLKGDGQDAAGILTSGALLTCDDVGVHPFAVTVKNSTNSVTRQVSITVPAPADNSCATPPVTTPTPGGTT